MDTLKKIPPWIRGLEDEDLNFIRRFLLASGSLKSVAREYGISYPTVRLRLNRLIAKVRILEDPQARSPFHQKIRMLVAEGKLELSVAKTLIQSYEDSQRKEQS
jgi:hypothetical protein